MKASNTQALSSAGEPEIFLVSREFRLVFFSLFLRSNLLSSFYFRDYFLFAGELQPPNGGKVGLLARTKLRLKRYTRDQGKGGRTIKSRSPEGGLFRVCNFRRLELSRVSVVLMFIGKGYGDRE